MKTKQDQQVNRIAEDYRKVFSTEEGKRVLSDIYSRTGIFKDVFDEDPYKHAHKAGRRAEGLKIMKILDQGEEQARRLIINPAEFTFN